MLDTIALIQRIARPPDFNELQELGWKPRHQVIDGGIKNFVLNGREESAPRLTFSRSPDAMWHLRAEVSVPAWLHGTNLKLPNEDEVETALKKLSTFVSERFPEYFNAYTAQVCRVDFTRDFNVGAENVTELIRRTAKVQMPRYLRQVFDDKTVYFSSSGKHKNKSIKI